MKSAYTKKDFINMKYDVSKLGDTDDILEVFPELQEYTEFRVQHIPKLMVSKTIVFKYVALVYDKESPYVRSYPSQTKRKKEVAKDLGLIINTVPKNIESLFLGESHVVNAMIICYGMITYDVDWLTLCTYTDKVYQSLFLLRNSTSIDKELNGAIIAWNSEIEKIKAKMLLADTSRRLNEELLKRVIDDNLGITPEERAYLNEGKVEK